MARMDKVSECIGIDSLMFNHAVIDEQHRDILYLGAEINRLFSICADRQEVLIAVYKYYDIVLTHFSCESSLIALLDPSKYKHHTDEHIRLHKSMIGFIRDAITDLEDGLSVSEIRDTFPILFNDMMNNIAVNDRELVGILEQEGSLRRGS